MTVLASHLVCVFAANMRKTRAKLKLSQEEVAHRSGLDRTYISGCERGVRNPSLTSLEKIAAALAISPDELLKDEPK